MELGIDGRVALVCGSSSGLGYAIAAKLATERCRVAMNGRDTERLAGAVRSVVDDGGDAEGFAADVGTREGAEGLVAQVAALLGAIDILVCNAGGPPSTVFNNTPVEEWQNAIDLSLLSSVHLARAALPLMRQRSWGRIVCLTSVAAKEPLPGLILSTTARAGVLGFTKSLSDEVATEGITVNAVCPGYMKTERVDDLVEERSQHEGTPPEQIMNSLVTNIPMRRMGEPEELAAAVAFLVSEPASYVTGIALQVDGGYIRSIL
jgi:3-oxoacyl-[acyl-carrier protein] reductase